MQYISKNKIVGTRLVLYTMTKFPKLGCKIFGGLASGQACNYVASYLPSGHLVVPHSVVGRGVIVNQR